METLTLTPYIAFIEVQASNGKTWRRFTPLFDVMTYDKAASKAAEIIANHNNIDSTYKWNLIDIYTVCGKAAN